MGKLSEAGERTTQVGGREQHPALTHVREQYLFPQIGNLSIHGELGKSSRSVWPQQQKIITASLSAILVPSNQFEKKDLKECNNFQGT